MLRKKLITGLLVGGVVGLVAFIVTFLRIPLIEDLELLTYDIRAKRSANPKNADPRIVMIDVDDNDIRWVQRNFSLTFPWPRSVFGDVTRHLLDRGARSVTFDFIFVDPGKGGARDDEKFAKVLHSSKRTVIGLQLTRYERSITAEGTFAARIARFPDCNKARPVAYRLLWWVTRVFLLPTKNQKACELWVGGEKSKDGLKKELGRLSGIEDLEEVMAEGPHTLRQLSKAELKRELLDIEIARRRGALAHPAPKGSSLRQYPHVLPPLVPLMRKDGLGVVTQRADADGMFRHYAPVMISKGRLFPSLALATARAAFPERKLSLKGNTLRFGKSKVTLNRDGNVAVRFHGSGNVYTRVGVRMILNVIAQKREIAHYEKQKKLLLPQLETALQDEAAIPKRMLAAARAMLKALDQGKCKKTLGKKLATLRAIDVQASTSALRMLKAAKALGREPGVPPQCQAAIHAGVEKVRSLARAFGGNPKKVKGLLARMSGLRHPARCEKSLKGPLERIRTKVGKVKTTVKQLIAAHGEIARAFGGATCQIPLRDDLRRELARQEKKQGARFKRFRDVKPGDPRGRIFMIHAAAAALRDLKPTPVDKNHLGAEINASFIDNLINNDFIRRSPRWVACLTALFLCLLCSFGTFLVIGLIRSAVLSAGSSLVIVTFVVGGYYAFARVTYHGGGIWVDVAAPSVWAGITWAAAIATNVYQEGKGRRFVQDALGRYTSPALVQELIKNPKALSLEWGEKRELSVFFSDIAGFTSISERLGAEKLVLLLNEYLTEMTDIILDLDGIVDKYIGDAVMAFWGAPVTDEEHAYKACLATLRMRHRMHELQPKWKEQFGEWLEFRAGINSGKAIAGNMGSKHKYNYTLMGDTVNLASRLEGANKPYDTFEMIGENTYAMVKDRMECRELDFIAVKGKERPVRVYELLGEKGEVAKEKLDQVEKFHLALEMYRKMQFQQALDEFKANGDDGPSRLYAKRCRDYIKTPPPFDWDGVFRMTTK